MASNNQLLVHTQDAANLIDQMSGAVSRSAFIGRARDYEGNSIVYNAVVRVDKAWETAFANLKKIAADETVMPVVQHEYAEREANKLIAVMQDTEATAMTEAEKYHNHFVAILEDRFRLDPSRAFPDSRLHDQMERAAAKEGGPATIRTLLDDLDYAKVFVTSKPGVLGLEPSVFNSLRAYAIRKHAPDAQIVSDNADKLIDLMKHYPGLRARIPRAFYSKAIAARVSTRFAPA